MPASRPAHRACGLDFGTSNSTLGVVVDGEPHLARLEGGYLTVPSAVFFGTDPDTAFMVGRAAVQAYVDGLSGRLLRSLKSILGSSLIGERTQVYRRRIAFSEIIEAYIAVLRRRAAAQFDAEPEAIVLGRPVHFVDDDPDGDRHAEETMRRIARNVGFAEVSFQFEPIAAAHDFERQVDRETIALIADIGGGTSDFTVARLGPASKTRADRASDILATGGIRLGGTDYDRFLSMRDFMPLLGYGTLQKRGDIEVPSAPYWDLSTWSKVHNLYDPRRIAEIRSLRQTASRPDLVERFHHVLDQHHAHSILMAVEEAKIALSDAETHLTDLSWVEEGLAARSTRAGFEAATADQYERLRRSSAGCVAEAGLSCAAVTAVFFTGGTSSIPSVRQAILGNFDGAQVIDGDRFGSVGTGLAIEAARRYG